MEYKDVKYDIELKAGWWAFGAYSRFVLGYKHDVSGVIGKVREIISNPEYGYQSTEKLNECIGFLNKVKMAVLQHKGNGNLNCNDIEYKDSLEMISCFVDEIEGYKKKWEIEEKKQPPKPQQLEINLTDKERELLYDMLIKGEFINEDWESFNYAFGGSMPKTFNRMHWNYSGLALFELLEVLTGTVSNKNRDICKGLFQKDKGDFNVPRPKSIKLDKREYSPYISKIEKIKAELKKIPTRPTD